MTRSVLVFLLVFAAAPRGSAGPLEAAVVAAMKLSDASSYAWATDVDDDARSYHIGGRLCNGYAWVTLPAIDDISGRLGRDADADIEAIFKGDTRSVVRVGDRWRSVKELPRPRRCDDEYMVLVPAVQNSLVDPDDEDPFGEPAMVPVLIHGPRRPGAGHGFSNARFALNAPHEELGIIVGSCASLEVEGDCAIGQLSDMGARLLLAPDNNPKLAPLAAGGTFKLWLQNGAVLHYQLDLTGILVVDKRQLVIHQRSDTRVNGLGTTRFTVPDEARLKLGGS